MYFTELLHVESKRTVQAHDRFTLVIDIHVS